MLGSLEPRYTYCGRFVHCTKAFAVTGQDMYDNTKLCVSTSLGCIVRFPENIFTRAYSFICWQKLSLAPCLGRLQTDPLAE